MNINYSDFEKNISKTFTGDKEPVDIEELINALHVEDKKPSIFLWKWMGAILLLAAVALGGYYISKSTETSYVSTNGEEDFLINNQKTIDNKNSVDESKTLTNRKSLKNEIQKSKENIKFTNNLKPITKSQIAVSNNTTSISKPISISSNYSPDILIETLPISATEINRKEHVNIPSSTQSNPSKKSISTLQKKKGMLSQIAYLSVDIPKLESISKVKKIPIKDVDCPAFSSKSPWGIDILPEIGIFSPIKTLTNGLEVDNEVLNQRKTDEKSLEGLQAALYVRLRHNQSPLYLKFGISTARTTERLSINQLWTDTTYMLGIIEVIESQNGDTLTVIKGQVPTYIEHSRNGSIHYSMNYIDIPISLGYSIPIGDRWRVGAEIGAIFNLSLSSKGKILTAENTFTEIETTGIRSAVDPSITAEFVLERRLTSNSAVYVSPRFRYFSSEVTPLASSIYQKYKFTGIHFGYIHSF